jgi:prepilin peptidase CpaA
MPFTGTKFLVKHSRIAHNSEVPDYKRLLGRPLPAHHSFAKNHHDSMISTIAAGVFLVVTALAAAFDLSTRRIPNALTVSAIILAIVLRAAVSGGAVLIGLVGAGLALLVMLPLFAMRGAGGGDAKLMIVVGAFLGPQGFVVALLATALVGGLMSIVAAVRSGVILPVLFNTSGVLGWMCTFGRRGERTTLVSSGAVSVPYGVAIAIGSVVALFIKGGI